ncbi:maltose alpha-D-glucosyltransferase/ alpha-amylase [Lachnospiraceae bacterium A10]|nr:maltose alpha-D-glucosyltransferase/ alpha-amylase [Lachnospiraceae bacterium A10]
MPKWLEDAVFYEIYPQSFKDTNGDGIGDIEGIIESLDYIRDLGCNALWINPWYDSPFKDAGYDVRDYYKVAPRYGTNMDAYRLFEVAHEKGIKVLLDLVPGHTSEEHVWFQESKKPEENTFSNRYIWSDGAFCGIPNHLYISGESDRDGVYMLNFFKCQPALNYGWGEVKYSWQSACDSPEAMATREAMKDVMRFWLDHGCDGFRVDMADSLVKDDDYDKSHTQAIWRNVREMLDQEYPEAAMVSEWSNPYQAIPGGFHMDFYLDHHGNGYNTLFRDYETEGGDHSYFKCDAGGDIRRFLEDYLPKYHATKNQGYISMFSCNHDTPRPKNSLSDEELKVAYAFLYTMPGVPFLYYGDEIGMRYQKLTSKEGGYQRTGSRTPMQWTDGENAGFSTCNPDRLYLPVDDGVDAPSVESQKKEEYSLYHVVKSVLALRHREKSLQADGSFEVVHAKKAEPFVYRRGEIVCIVNPDSASAFLPEYVAAMCGESLFTVGRAERNGSELAIGGQSFAAFRIVKS